MKDFLDVEEIHPDYLVRVIPSPDPHAAHIRTTPMLAGDASQPPAPKTAHPLLSGDESPRLPQHAKTAEKRREQCKSISRQLGGFAKHLRRKSK